jgi:cbb3-type cytochrome oxidase cytochrome c subunit
MGENIGKAIMSLIIIALICLAVSVVLGITLIFNSINTIESKTKIQPDFRLEVNGKKVDTIWVYKLKSE